MSDSVAAGGRSLDRFVSHEHQIASDLSFAPAFDRLLLLATKVLDVPIALISLARDAGDVRVNYSPDAAGSMPVTRPELLAPLCHAVRESTAPVAIENAQLQPLLEGSSALLGPVACLGVPLVDSAGMVLGAFCIVDLRPRVWSEREIDMLHELAASAVTEIALRNEVAERQRTQALLTGQSEVLQLIAGGAALTSVLDRLARFIEAQSAGLICSILLLDADLRTLHHAAGPSLPHCYIQAIDGMPIGPSAGSCGTAAYLGQPVFVGDIAADPRWSDYCELAQQHKLAACWSMPICSTTGSVLGTFAMYYRERRQPTPQDLRLIEVASHIAGIAIERWQAETAVQQANEALERRVQERTAELARANQDLQRQMAERERAEQALLEREELLEAIIASSPDMIATLDLGGRFLLLSPAYEEVLGYPLSELEGKNVFELVHPADLQAITSIHQQGVIGAINQGAARYRCRCADGSWVTLESRARFMPDASGQPSGVVVVTRNVEQQVRLEAALKQAKEDAEEANRAKNEFLSRMSHELRTPLNAVLGFAQLLALDELSSPHAESVNYILRGGQHLLSLINEVLDITRIEAGRLALTTEPIELTSLLTEAIELIRPLARQREIALDLEIAASCPVMIEGDQQRLKQVLLNLLSNATKYNRKGGRIRLTAERTGAHLVRINVCDTGVGIPQEKLAFLFTPFERLGAEHSGVEGTGLGLALSKSLVGAMGGRIGVDSVVGQGSTFWIELRCWDDARWHGFIHHRATPAGGDVAPTQRPARTVLVIEDHLANLRLIEHVLGRTMDLRLVPAMQGILGLELAAQHRPDLIVLDLELPDIAGEETLLRLRQDATTRSTPVLVISADATARQIERVLALGAAAYLGKPLDVQQFLKVVNALLGCEPA